MRLAALSILLVGLVGCQEETPDSSAVTTSVDLDVIVAAVAPEGIEWRGDRGGSTKIRLPGSAQYEAHRVFRMRGSDDDVAAFTKAIGDRLQAEIRDAGGELDAVDGQNDFTYTSGDARGQVTIESTNNDDEDHPHTITVRLVESVGTEGAGVQPWPRE